MQLNFGEMEGIALLIVALVALIQMSYWFIYFIRLARYKDETSTNAQEPVSVIIVARNEYQNLQKNLPAFLDQDYPNYELIVVNNGSWDRSEEYLEGLEREYPHFRLVNIKEQERYPKGKKFGLTLGIKAAKHEWLLLSDSDCQPADKQWISKMQAHFTDKKSIVLGYSPYQKSNSLLNLLIRFDTFYTALQYLSFALAGQTYMGVGRNLAYRKSLFFSVKGFASHNHIMSGDDDLFVNETATKDNVAISIEPESFVESEPKKSFGEWFKQKRRHMHTGQYYKSGSKWKLAFMNLMHLLFYPTLAIAFVYAQNIYWPLGVYGVRLIAQMSIFGPSMAKLKDINLIYFLPFLDLWYAVYYFFMGSLTLLSGKQKKW